MNTRKPRLIQSVERFKLVATEPGDGMVLGRRALMDEREEKKGATYPLRSDGARYCLFF